MGFRFRKSINLGGGMRLNLNKKSAGLSFGGKGFRYSINTNGKRTASAGIPGTGLYYTKSSGGGKKRANIKKLQIILILRIMEHRILVIIICHLHLMEIMNLTTIINLKKVITLQQ